jgi:gas vesicle protein
VQYFTEGSKFMSQRDGFASGFLAGAVFGGVVGGIVGALLASRGSSETLEEEDRQMTPNSVEGKKSIAKRRQIRASEAEGMEMELARRSLEDKIAQLNATIDEVRQQLGNVNGNSEHPKDKRPSPQEELRS